MTVSIEELVNALKIWQDCGRSTTKAALVAGIPRKTFEGRIKTATLKGLAGYEPVLHGFEIKQVSTSTSPSGKTRTSVTQRPERAQKFTPLDGLDIRGRSTNIDGDYNIISQWVLEREGVKVRDVIGAIKSAFVGFEARMPVIPAPAVTDADLLSVYPIADLHLGMLANAPESGQNYDLKIASARLRSCMKRLIDQSPRSKQALIINLGDWTHSDNQKNMTPNSGHILDTDGRYFKILTTGVHLMMDCISMALEKHETVLVRNIPGNHDPMASIALTVALCAFYHDNERVTIDDSPSEWFYYRFGTTLMGAHHGHKAKPSNMAMTMAVNRREDWGATLYHWILFGHIHHESAREVGDVRCESFQTIASKDAYSAGAGYSSGQSLSSVTLHISEGEIGRHRVNLSPLALT